MRLSDLAVDRFLAEKPLAITLAGLEELRAHITARAEAFDSAPRDFIENMAALMVATRATPARGRPSSNASSSTGIIPIFGTISQHAPESGDLSANLFAASYTETISEQLDAFLADESVSKIVLNIDSPGGLTGGVSELANKIMAARGQKPIVAVANSLAASAAYWIGSAADQFFASPGATVGSIGVYAMHQDVSKMAEDAGVKTTFISAGKYKTGGNQFEPLDDATKSRIQQRVDDTYAMFVRDVARGRGVPEATVRGGFGEGDVLMAKRAKAEGMIDGVLTFDDVLSRTYKASPASEGVAAEDVDPPVQVDDPNPGAGARLDARKLRRMQLAAVAAD
jgi:signal peptide peptidase SppA